ncbi:MAG: LPS-assembly protein LptD [Rhodospirillaceae bacterium]|nr:LPS-assembly protein LptD [Rhodospirillaceae bacterium]
MRRTIVGVLLALGLLSAAGARAAERPAVPLSQGPDKNAPVLLLADEVTYDRELGLAVARGNVEVSQNDRVLRADTLTYNERTRIVTASGHVALLEPSGEVTFAEYVELTDDLKEGVIKNVGLLLSDRQTRAAAAYAVRTGGTRTVLDKAVFSPCELCADDPTEPPLWQLKAVKVIHDQTSKTIEYHDAWLEIYGVPVFYSPYMSHPDPTVKRKSGFLLPTVGQSDQFGWFAEVPYFWVLSDDKDITISPQFQSRQGVTSSKPGFVLDLEYRQRFRDGSLRLEGSATIADREREHDGVTSLETNQLRGHIDGEGRFDIDDHWRWGFDAERATDKTYLRLYRISDAGTLTSRLFTEGFYGRSYVTADAYAFQGLRSTDTDAQAPFIAPDVSASYVGEPDALGGYFNADADALVLTRTDGRDSRRLHGRVGYHLPYTAPAGDIYTLDASLTADGYWVEGVDPASDDVDPESETFSGFVGRVLPQVYGEWRYPFVRRHTRASEILEPILGLALAPTGGNTGKIPNEDSLEFEFDETHLFDPDRFAGLDRVDSGGRLDYGVKWSLLGDSGGYTSLLLGQSLRLYGDSEFPANSGLEDTLSDVVGRVEFQPTYNLDLNYRFRFDTEKGRFDRNELSLKAGPPILHGTLSYAFAATDSDDSDSGDTTEQVLASLTSQLSDHWSATVASRYDLDDDRPLSEGLALTYSDECFLMRLSVGRSHYRDDEIEPSTTFLFTVGLKYLGTFGVPITGLFGPGSQ